MRARWRSWPERSPGAWAIPRPPNFHGTTFVQAGPAGLLPRSAHACTARSADGRPARRQLPLWCFLDGLRPLPAGAKRARDSANAAAIRQHDGRRLSCWLALTYQPNRGGQQRFAAQRLARVGLQLAVQRAAASATPLRLAIPVNARARQGAGGRRTSFLPVARRRRLGARHRGLLGDPAVLAVERLSPAERARLRRAAGARARSVAARPVLPNRAHGSWVDPIEGMAAPLRLNPASSQARPVWPAATAMQSNTFCRPKGRCHWPVAAPP